MDRRLYNAIFKGRDRPKDLKAVSKLIKEGVNINAQETEGGQTALHIAATYGDSKTVKLLFDAKADINIRDDDNQTAFQCSITNIYKADIIKMFIEAGANVDSKGFFDNTILHHTVGLGDFSMTEYLLSHGAITNSKNHLGQTPLHSFCTDYNLAHLNKKVIKYLLKHNANLNELNHKGRTPLLCMLNNCYTKRSVEELQIILRFLLDYSDVNIVDFEGKNILTTNSNSNMVEVILEHLAKLQALNIPIAQAILDTISNGYQIYFKKCTDELDAARRTKLHNSWVTYFNLLIDNDKSLKNYAGNQVLVEDFKKSDCLSEFPIYGALMKRNVESGIKRRKLFDNSAESLSDCLPIFSPTHLIIRGVLDYFDKEDMTKLCEENIHSLLSTVAL